MTGIPPGVGLSHSIRVTAGWYIGGVCANGSSLCACEVLDTQPEGMPPAALGDLLRRLGQVGSRTDAHRAAAIAEAERTHAAEAEGFRSITEWLAALTGEPVGVARSQVAVAEALQVMPETRAAFAAGQVPESRVRLLAQAQALAPEQFAQDEAVLVAQAASVPSQRLPQVFSAWGRQADLPGAEVQAQRLHSLRALHLSKHWSGLLHLSGDLDPESGLVVLQAIGSLADPANLDANDPRTPAQARADALVEIFRRYHDGNPGKGSSRPQLQITIPWATLQTGQGLVDTEVGPISAKDIRRLACDATISHIVLDQDGMPLAAGPARRSIPPVLRRALDLRDKGCTHPGCDAPVRWCEAHHIIPWAEGGKTELANLRLLCRNHHRTAHDHQPYPRRQ